MKKLQNSLMDYEIQLERYHRRLVLGKLIWIDRKFYFSAHWWKEELKQNNYKLLCLLPSKWSTWRNICVPVSLWISAALSISRFVLSFQNIVFHLHSGLFLHYRCQNGSNRYHYEDNIPRTDSTCIQRFSLKIFCFFCTFWFLAFSFSVSCWYVLFWFPNKTMHDLPGKDNMKILSLYPFWRHCNSWKITNLMREWRIINGICISHAAISGF